MKLDRLLAITMLLLNRGKVTGKALADHFEVSLRTIYRDLEAINRAGIPIVSYSGIAGGYEIMERYRLDRQFLNLSELQSIVVALNGMRTALDDREIGTLLDKVGTLLSRTEQGLVAQAVDQLIVDFNPWHGSDNEGQKLKMELLREAIRDMRIVRLVYLNADGEETERTVEPMGLVLKGYVWYLHGYCLLRDDYRIFRLSRMRRAEACAETFVRRDKALEELEGRWERRGAIPQLQLVLHFAASAKVQVYDRFKPEQIETMPDGTLLVRAAMTDHSHTYATLLAFGADMKVLEPADVAAAVLAKARAIVARYEQ